MAGSNYTRQSSFSDGDVVTAALFNDEYNQLLNAFVYASTGTTGHQHDGGAGEGGNIEIIGDQDFLNKILVDSTNNRWGFYVQVSSGTVEQIRIQDGAIVPVTDNDIDLGTSSLQFKDAFINGTLEADAITIAGITLSETIADTVGAMVSSNTETGITVSYQDADNTLDFAIGTLNQNTTGNAATATALATARTIHGVSFDGTANIDLAEVISDTVGAMFSGNTETGVTATYQDSDNTIDLVISGVSDTTGNAATATALETARTIGGTSFDGSANIAVGLAATATALATARTIGGTSFDGSANIAVGLANTATTLATARTIHGVSFNGSANIDLSEVISDTVGAMFSSNTETGIAATYQDGDNTIDLVIGDDVIVQSMIADNAIDSQHYVDGSIDTAHVADDGITSAKLAHALDVVTSVSVGGASNGVILTQGDIALKNGGTRSTVKFYCEQSNAHYAQIQAPAHSAFSGNVTLTLPASTDTLAGIAATQTLSNKTLAHPLISGDTGAGDDAALGYTSAEGIIVTGQGSTSDVTLKNDADGTVLTIPTGTTNVDVVGDFTAGTLNADGDTAAGDTAAIGYTAAEGLILTGQGSTNDVTIKNDADADVIEIPTGTTNVTIAGTLDVGGAKAKVAGLETIYVPAAGMYPETTNGSSGLAQVELSNGPELKCLDFAAAADDFAQFQVIFPKSWNEGTVTFQAFFTVTGTNTGTVAWGLAGRSFADNADLNTAFGTQVVATAKAHSGTSNDIDVAAVSGAVTIAGAAADTLTIFQIARDVSADSQSGAARLLGIKLFFTTDAANDA